VLLTLAVPEMADPEDAAALVADAAATSALEVRHAVGVEGHLPAPGATVVRPGRRQPWQVVAVTADTLRLRDLAGDVAEVSRRSVRPDPLDVPAALEAFDTRSRGSRCWQEMAVSVWSCGPVSRGRSSTRRVGPDGSSSRSSRLVTRVCELRHARYVRDTGRGWRWSGTGGSAPVTSTRRRRSTRWRPR